MHLNIGSTTYIPGAKEMLNAGYSMDRKYYSGAKLVKRTKIITRKNKFGMALNWIIAMVYSYPVYNTSKISDISYEPHGSEYYDDDIEEKLGGERITLGQ